MSILQANGAGLGGAGDPGGALGSFYSTTIDQSLRLNAADSAHLTFAQGTATDIAKWTVNFWLKRTEPLAASDDYDAVFGVDGPGTTGLAFLGGNLYLFINYNTGGSQARLITNRVFRDPSAWYNFHISFDRANSTNAHKVRLYINGVEETSFSTDERSSITSSSSSGWNVSGLTAAINRRSGGVNSRYHNGYLAQFYNIDGQVLDPTSFIEISNGVCKPISYSGTYGNNGWLLEFKQTGTGTGASNTVGADTSGNNNHWTSSGVAAHDVMTGESPTNNFATWNVLQPTGAAQGVMTLSEGNMKATGGSSIYRQVMGNMSVLSGKWYTEFYITDAGYPSWQVGWTKATRYEAFTGAGTESTHLANFGYFTGSNVYISTFGQASTGTTYAYSGIHTAGDAPTTGDIIGCAADFDNGKLWWSINGEWINIGAGAGDPANGTNPSATYTASTYADDFKSPHYLNYNGSAVLNTGQDSTFAGNTTAGGNSDANGYGDFKYSVPSGFLALCTANLPEATIGPNSTTTSDEHFNTVLYTGNGSTQSITGVGFQPDWTWLKSRSNALGHNVFDVIRGANVALFPNDSNAEFTDTDRLNSFDSDGFSLGADTNVNTSSATYVSWNWKAGGTAVSNTDGSITSSVSANQDAGFSIATWTGNQTAGATVGHGLSQAPEMYIVKARGAAASWAVYHSALGATKWMLLNSSQAATTSAQEWNNTEPTSTVVSLGNSSANSNQSATYVGYFFHSVEGHLKCGSYVGNANADGTFVYLGFRPRWLMLKDVSSTNIEWNIYYDEASPFNVMNDYIAAASAAAEATNISTRNLDFVSNGFKLRDAYAQNYSADYVYIAFAQTPFKYANAR